MLIPDTRAALGMDDELAKTKSGQDDDYMEEGDAEESVRAGVRVLDEDSDREDGEGDEAEEGDGTSDDSHRMRDNTPKDMSAISSELAKNDLKDKAYKIWCESDQSEKNVIRKTKKTIPPPAVPASSPEIHGSNGKKFPQQYYQIRANRMRTDNEVILGGLAWIQGLVGRAAGRTVDSTFRMTTAKCRQKTFTGLMWAGTFPQVFRLTWAGLQCATLNQGRDGSG